MKILIPSHSFDFTQEVRQVLQLARIQGFSIAEVELGVSSTPFVELVDTTSSCISTNLFPVNVAQGDHIERTFIYGDSESSSLDNIYIGFPSCNGLTDSWVHDGNPVFLSNVKPLSIEESWRHFAWIITSLALDFPLEDALVLSRAAMHVSRETWPIDYSYFPSLHLPSREKGKFKVINKESLGVYPVVNSVGWVQRLLLLGIRTIQLRIEESELEDVEPQIIEAIKLGRKHNAQVFIHGLWELAIKYGASGVHLRLQDIADTDLEEIAKSGLKLGVTVQGYFDLLRIQHLSPSYVELTSRCSSSQGLVRLRLYQLFLDSMPYGNTNGVPSVAIGGINTANITDVMRQGVSGIGVVRAITEAKNVTQSVEELQGLFASYRLSEREGLNVL